jgi:hypothetical protein
MMRGFGVSRLLPPGIALAVAATILLAACAENDADGPGEPLPQSVAGADERLPEVPLWIRMVDEDTVGLRSPTFR